ncbi:MAG TPA: class I SAM-dependent methyltransferase, partial [Baekduia sp.]|nr:class I SAM-dependent methyltransferase [Baekduia sp.]
MATTDTPLDEARVQEFVGRFAGDLGAALHQTTVIIGDKLGLYAAMGDCVPVTPGELAERTGTEERYVREWLCAQAASGYVEYDAAAERFRLTPEQAACLADRESPTFLPGAFYIAASLVKDEPALTERFRTGEGFGWHEHDGDLFCGTELFFRPGYVANLVPSWLPALGVDDKLRAGGTVADIGCGHGASTIVMAQAFPNSRFVGFDLHEGSVEVARQAAERAGVGDRVRFEVAGAKDFPGRDYDLVCVFDALHDMGDPVGAAAHIRSALTADGTLLIVEPMSGESVLENCNPIGKLFYSAGTFICVPHARSQGGVHELGPQVPEATWGALLGDAGFT